jgi:hypothetical protein
MSYSEKLDNAIDELRDMLLDTDGDYDIHDMIETVSMNHDVEKSDLLDWYDNDFE